jgi:hypothetical protein
MHKPTKPNSDVVITLFLLSFVGWVLFIIVSAYLSGDAIGTSPSKDGFVVTNHGRKTTVSESVWLFSLFFSSGMLLLLPSMQLPMFVRLFLRNQAKRWTRWLIGAFLLVWFAVWYLALGRSTYDSIMDWNRWKQTNPSIQRTGASRFAQSAFVAQWRLAPAADADCSALPLWESSTH